jgi:hypothetical protein
VRRFICIPISKTDPSSQGTGEVATKIALRQHDSNKCYGLVVQVSVKDCERKAINANLCLVVAALSVTGAHQRTIEPFISIILISLSVLDWSDCRTRMSTIWLTARSQFLQRHRDALCLWMECDNKEGMRNRALAKTRGDKNAQQLSKYPAWRAKALRDL